MPKREALKGNTEVDTAVIGAGMAGVLTAWFLQQEGQRVAVLPLLERAAGKSPRKNRRPA